MCDNWTCIALTETDVFFPTKKPMSLGLLYFIALPLHSMAATAFASHLYRQFEAAAKELKKSMWQMLWKKIASHLLLITTYPWSICPGAVKPTLEASCSNC